MNTGIVKKYSKWPIVILCLLLVFQTAWSQTPTAQQALQIVIVEGAGARNVVQQIPPRPLVVRIQDQNNRVVPGATVTFAAPEKGPSGEFSNDARTVQVVTGADGTASAGAFHPNDSEGPYQILVRAEFRGQTGTAAILQTNISKGGGHKKLIAILAIAGGAAAAGVAARGNSGSSSSSGGPTITLGGTPAVGAPK
jgi:hypothetical protein